MEKEEKKFKFPLNLQLFASKEDGEDDDDDDELDEADFEDEEEDDEESDENEDGEEKGKGKKKQSKKQDHDFAEKRRKREEEQKKREDDIRKAAFEEGKKAGRLESSKVNTFTNEPIEDEYDLKIFEIQKQLKAEGKDPQKDLPKRLAELNRQEAKEKKDKDEKDKKEQENVQKDVQDFVKEVGSAAKAKEIYNDPKFQRFIDGKEGTKPLKDLYREYLEFKKDLGVDDEEDSDEEGKKKGGTPSPNGKKGSGEKSYSKLSPEEKQAFLKKNGLI